MPNLLIVEDDRDLASAITEVLESEGHEIRVAYHGREGLERIYERTPDLIVLDVQMPALDGPAMIRRLDALEAVGGPIPIVVMSGITELATIAETIGTPYFLHKPFSADNLILIVESALKGVTTSSKGESTP